jgi:hypothetical protein
MENSDKQEILSAIAALDTKLTGRIDGLDAKIDASHSELVELIQDLSTSTDERFTAVEGRLTGIEKDIRKIDSEMVTKDYLDRKLADKEMDTLALVKKTYVRQ